MSYEHTDSGRLKHLAIYHLFSLLGDLGVRCDLQEKNSLVSFYTNRIAFIEKMKKMGADDLR